MTARRRLLLIVLGLVVTVVAGGLAYARPLLLTATGYAAHNACAVRLVAERPPGSAADDLPPNPLVPLLRNLEIFFQRESCGWCTPCRDGLPWGVKLLTAINDGEGQVGDVEQLEGLTRDLWIGKTFCAHAPGAMEPLMMEWMDGGGRH